MRGEQACLTRPPVILTLSDHLHHLHMFCDGQRLLLICHQSTHPPEAKCELQHKKGKGNAKKQNKKGKKIAKKKYKKGKKTHEMEDTAIGAAVNCARRNHTYHHSKLITSFKNSHPRKNILQI